MYVRVHLILFPRSTLRVARFLARYSIVLYVNGSNMNPVVMHFTTELICVPMFETLCICLAAGFASALLLLKL